MAFPACHSCASDDEFLDRRGHMRNRTGDRLQSRQMSDIGVRRGCGRRVYRPTVEFPCCKYLRLQNAQGPRSAKCARASVITKFRIHQTIFGLRASAFYHYRPEAKIVQSPTSPAHFDLRQQRPTTGRATRPRHRTDDRQTTTRTSMAKAGRQPPPTNLPANCEQTKVEPP